MTIKEMCEIMSEIGEFKNYYLWSDDIYYSIIEGYLVFNKNNHKLSSGASAYSEFDMKDAIESLFECISDTSNYLVEIKTSKQLEYDPQQKKFIQLD